MSLSDKITKRSAEDTSDFLIESANYLDEVEPYLAKIRTGQNALANKDEVGALFRAFHSIKGVAGFLQFSNIQKLTHRAEELLDCIRSGKGELRVTEATILLQVCDGLRAFLKNITDSGSDSADNFDLPNIMAQLETTLSEKKPESKGTSKVEFKIGKQGEHQNPLFPIFQEPALLESALQIANAMLSDAENELMKLLDAPKDLAPIQSIEQIVAVVDFNLQFLGNWKFGILATGFRQYLSALNQLPQKVTHDIALMANTLSKLTQLIFNPEAIVEADLEVELKKLSMAANPETPALDTSTSLESKDAVTDGHNPDAKIESGGVKSINTLKTGKTEMRVSLEKLDKLVELIEELGVVAGGVINSKKSTDQGIEGGHQFDGKLLQVTEELQEVAISVRQVPASQLFKKMIRLVADVSEKLGKQAKLNLLGEETEMDREVLDALGDPLVHIVRNCLDHGLETPEERKQVGKPESGTLTLEAWHGNGDICISISDDGKGIHRNGILKRAIENGLVPRAAQDWPDGKVFEILFMAGFSTREKVTEFSGRGVGMDVVKKTVEQFKGHIEIESVPGKGSRFLIRIPEANALTESMLIRIGNVRYILRISSIRETFKPDKNKYTKFPDGREYVCLRDNHYPVIRISKLEGFPEDILAPDSELLVLLENRGKQMALAIDEVLGKVQGVIKSSPPYLKSATAISGYSIIGTDSDDVAWSFNLDALENGQITEKSTRMSQ